MTKLGYGGTASDTSWGLAMARSMRQPKDDIQRGCASIRCRHSLVAWRAVFGILVVQLASCGCDHSRTRQSSPPAPQSIIVPSLTQETEVPVASVYREEVGFSRPFQPPVDEPQVIVAFWKDGRAVWSADNLEGGPPYQAGRIDPGLLATALSECEAAGVFREPALRQTYYPVDSSYTVLVLVHGPRLLHMASCHELFESNPKLVATAYAVEPLEGRSRKAVLASQPKTYRRFRTAWKDIRARLTALIPTEGGAAIDAHFELRTVRANETSRRVPPPRGSDREGEHSTLPRATPTTSQGVHTSTSRY